MSEKVIDRVFQYIEHEGIPHTRFEKAIGLSNGYLNTQRKRSADLGEGVLNKIIDNCLNMNIEWLITGRGEMIKKSTNQVSQIIKASDSNVGIPLVRIEAFGGFGNSVFSIEEKDIQARYVVPDFEDSDFMIRVKGNSMSPKYNSGDVAACKILRQRSFIQWNKTHVIGTHEQGILIKRLKKGPDSSIVTAVSDNTDYEPFDIPWTEITGIALVIGVIRLE
jgi:repressor LexA